MPKDPLKGFNIASRNRYQKRQNAHPNAVDFIPAEFDHLLEDQGTRVRITPTLLCPNRTALEDTNHVLDCPLCFGDEVIEVGKDAAESWASITGIDLDKQFQVNGIFDMKDARMTFQTGIRVYYWYKIEILDFASIYNQLIKRSLGDTDKLRYKPVVPCDTPFRLIDSNGKLYDIGVNYRVEDQNIHWVGTQRPAAGTLFSICYPMLPTFRVLELINDNRYYYIGFKHTVKSPIQLPQQALVRWDYLAKRSGSNEVPVP